MNKLLISVITPSYNQATYIEETIRSVLSQKVNSGIEYLVMDGGSTDGTLHILDKYSGQLTWVSENDKGQSDALNKGVARAQGEIIGWLNSDDLYLPGALQKVMDYFSAHPDCLWLYGKSRIIDENGVEVRKLLSAYKNLVSSKFFYPLLLLENFISQPSVFFRRSAFEAAGPLELDLPLAMDYDLWLRLGKMGPPGIIHDRLSCFRVHKQAKSTQNIRKQFIEQYRIHKRHDRRRMLLFLHRLNIFRTICGYWVMGKWNRLSGK
jgi:glycosyltransferase involved in cell wall biosynthesis